MTYYCVSDGLLDTLLIEKVSKDHQNERDVAWLATKYPGTIYFEVTPPPVPTGQWVSFPSEFLDALHQLNSAYARYQLDKGYTHLMSADLARAIINVLKAGGLHA